jgi:hypothetical protein
LGDVGIDGEVILKYILKKLSVWVWIGFNLLWMGSNGEPYEHGNEPLGSTKGRDFIDQLSYYQLLKKTLLHELVKYKNSLNSKLRKQV